LHANLIARRYLGSPSVENPNVNIFRERNSKKIINHRLRTSIDDTFESIPFAESTVADGFTQLGVDIGCSIYTLTRRDREFVLNKSWNSSNRNSASAYGFCL